MHIPFMRLDRQFAQHREEFMQAVKKVFSHGQVLQGPEVSDLEERLARFFGVKHSACVGSGTDALILAMKALNMKAGARVAVTALSFVASASAIVQAGGIPVFVDIEQDYCCAREDVLLGLVKKEKVDGVIAVHMYGQMMELGKLYAEARKRRIFLIEDAAQALGASRHGITPGSFSNATCLSFDPTKVIGAQGSGGAVLTNDPDTAQRVKMLRYHGHVGGRVYNEIGYNSQLPVVQAALLLTKFTHEAAWRKRRRKIAERFTEVLESLEGVIDPKVRPGNEHNFHKYVIHVEEGRDELIRYLREKGISTSVHYSMPLHKQPCFSGRHELAGDMGEVERKVHHILSLPIYPEMTNEEVDYICRVLKSYI